MGYCVENPKYVYSKLMLIVVNYLIDWLIDYNLTCIDHVLLSLSTMDSNTNIILH